MFSCCETAGPVAQRFRQYLQSVYGVRVLLDAAVTACSGNVAIVWPGTLSFTSLAPRVLDSSMSFSRKDLALLGFTTPRATLLRQGRNDLERVSFDALRPKGIPLLHDAKTSLQRQVSHESGLAPLAMIRTGTKSGAAALSMELQAIASPSFSGMGPSILLRIPPNRINERLQLQKLRYQAGIVTATQLLQFQSEWHCSRRQGW